MITPIPITSLENAPTSINLQRLAVFDTGYIGSELEGFTSSEAAFGGQIALKGYGLPEQTAPDEAISIKLYWKALAEMTSDYTILVHVEDEAGNMIAPFDVPPRGNTLPTSTWPPDYPLADEIVITAPSTSQRPSVMFVPVRLRPVEAPGHGVEFVGHNSSALMLAAAHRFWLE